MHLVQRFLVLAAFSSLCFADAPQRPPAPTTVCSSSKTVCLRSDPKSGTRVYRVRADGSEASLWSMPGWFRVAFVSNDGRHVVTGYDGVLLPLTYSRDLPILTFWREGALVRSVPISAVIEDLSHLQRTASHYRWGEYVGFNASGHFVVKTVEWSSVTFDVATGQKLER